MSHLSGRVNSKMENPPRTERDQMSTFNTDIRFVGYEALRISPEDWLVVDPRGRHHFINLEEMRADRSMLPFALVAQLQELAVKFTMWLDKMDTSTTSKKPPWEERGSPRYRPGVQEAWTKRLAEKGIS